MPTTKVNGTLMARTGLGDDHRLMFSQVELRGLEPLIPCLQSMAKMSSTVHGPGTKRSRCPSEYNDVQACWCRLWVSARPTESRGAACFDAAPDVAEPGPPRRRAKPPAIAC
jgi:hypothetical protein